MEPCHSPLAIRPTPLGRVGGPVAVPPCHAGLAVPPQLRLGRGDSRAGPVSVALRRLASRQRRAYVMAVFRLGALRDLFGRTDGSSKRAEAEADAPLEPRPG